MRFTHLLTMMLPPGATRALPVGRGRCTVDFGKTGLVTIQGPSRAAVFDQAAVILRAACRGLGPASVAMRRYDASGSIALSGDRDWIDLRGRADAWTAIVNADVAFSPTGLDPEFVAPAAIEAVLDRLAER